MRLARYWVLGLALTGCVNVTAPDLSGLGDAGDADDGSAAFDAGLADVQRADGDHPLIANGKPCTAGSRCASGLCVDGICCKSACGTCQACNLPGTEGSCSPIPAGHDSMNACAIQPAISCGMDGTCDGRGACRRYPAGTACVP